MGIENAIENAVYALHLQKWTRFAHWYDLKHIAPTTALLPDVLDYILELQTSGLSPSSISIHLAATLQ